MFGHIVPIWSVVLIEFVLAYLLEIFIGSPKSFKIALKMFNPKRKQIQLYLETVIICVTVLIMCPAMSFLASIMYYPYNEGFNIFTLLANWIKLICYNFPFAFWTNIFIQPLIRKVFRILFRKDIEGRKKKNGRRKFSNYIK